MPPSYEGAASHFFIKPIYTDFTSHHPCAALKQHHTILPRNTVYYYLVFHPPLVFVCFELIASITFVARYTEP